MWPIDPDCWQVSFGAAFFIPTVIVPLLLITHGLIFRILLKHDGPTAYTEKTYRRKNAGSSLADMPVDLIAASPLPKINLADA